MEKSNCLKVIILLILFTFGCGKPETVKLPISVSADPEVKVYLEEILKTDSEISSAVSKRKYSISIIEPDKNTNYKILRVTPDPVKGYEITIIDPKSGEEMPELKKELSKTLENKLKERKKESKVAIQTVAQGNNGFALDLYHKLGKSDENIFFSPYSIFNVLSMVAEGARGETALEMGNVLNYPNIAKYQGQKTAYTPWKMSLIHSQLSAINNRLQIQNEGQIRKRVDEAQRKYMDSLITPIDSATFEYDKKFHNKIIMKEKLSAEKLGEVTKYIPSYEFRISNSLWGEKSYPFLKKYINTISRYYRTGGIFSADFVNNPSRERIRINKWVEENTHHRIKNIIANIDPLTRLILVNAMYFNGTWENPFTEKNTKILDFTLSDGSNIKTEIMRKDRLRVARYAAFNADGSFFNTPFKIRRGQKTGLYPGKRGFSLMELPYKYCGLSMVFIAPNSPDGLPDIETNLTYRNLTGWINNLHQRKTNIYIPKFKIEKSYKLNDYLIALGMERAFNPPEPPDGADLSGMSASDNASDSLYITSVIHKTFVEVNERGTEAAAATRVMIAVASSQVDVQAMIPFIPTFKADRPFIFLIRDRGSGAILFMGKIVNPGFI